jgi:hypothetical protein
MSQDAFDWACCMFTHAAYLYAGVQERADKKDFRAAYVGIRPAMEAALKCLWVMGKAKRKSLPQRIDQLITGVEDVFPGFQKIFSVQMKRKDRRGGGEGNGCAHAAGAARNDV